MDIEKANEFCEGVRKLKNDIEGAFLTLGGQLYLIREEKLFRGQHEDFNAFLDDIKISRSVASRLITVYQRFVLEWQIPEAEIVAAGGWSEAYEICMLSEGKEQAQELLEEIAPLNASDKRQVLREAKTGKKAEDCAHEWEDVHFKQCKGCGTREKVYEE